MENLNANTLAEVMRHCRDYPEYQAVIVMDEHSRFLEFRNSMRQYLRNDEDGNILSVSRAGIIKFKNGSYIRPVMADSGVRGLCAHEIVFDDGVEDKTSISARIRKLVYHCREETEKPVTLDEFLNEFKIL